MGKKSKEEVPAISNVTNRDILQRLNFLYQASAYLNSVHPSVAANRSTGLRKVAGMRDLAKSYACIMNSVGQKTTVKLDPAVKRTICKRCLSLLIPGITLSLRIKRSAQHTSNLHYRCTTCRLVHTIPTPVASTTGDQPFEDYSNKGRQHVPFSLREAGHIVFRGGEKLAQLPAVDNGLLIS